MSSPPSAVPGYPTRTYGTNPWLGALGGLFSGAIQSYADYGANPRGGGGIATILGGGVQGFRNAKLRQAQIAEVIRQEDRANMDAVVKTAQRRGVPVSQVLQEQGGAKVMSYDPSVGNGAAEAGGAGAIGQSLRIPNAEAMGYAAPGILGPIFQNVQKQYQEQGTLNRVPGAIVAGSQMAGNPTSEMQPLQSTVSMIPSAARALRIDPLSGQVVQSPTPQPVAAPSSVSVPTMAPKTPAAPSIQQPLEPVPPTDPWGNPYAAPQAPIQARATQNETPAAPLWPDLAGIGYNSPDASELVKAYEAGGKVTGDLNTQRASLYNARQTEQGNREQAALGAVNTRDRTDAYRQSSDQIKNVVELLQGGTPEQQAIAKEALTKGSGGSKMMTPSQRASYAAPLIDEAPYAKDPSERQKILRGVDVLREQGASEAELKAVLDSLPRYGVPMPGDPPQIKLPATKPSGIKPVVRKQTSRGLQTRPLSARLAGSFFGR